MNHPHGTRAGWAARAALATMSASAVIVGCTSTPSTSVATGPQLSAMSSAATMPSTGSTTSTGQSDPAGNTAADNSGPATDTGGQPAHADGDYTATGWYGGLPSHLDVSLTLVDDVIVEVDVTPTATNEISLQYQQDFADAIPAAVIGRDIDDADVGRLAGSSGCPDGFNDALRQIRAQAAQQ